MKKYQIAVVFFMAITLFTVEQVSAQNTPLLIGVIDLAAIFQKHPVAADEVPLLQQKVQKEMAEFQTFQQSCQKKLNEIKNTYKVGTPEFETQTRPIRDQFRDAEAQLQEKQSQAMTQLNKMRYKMYTDIQACIQAVAEQKQIIIVHAKIKVNRKNVTEEMAALQEADSNQVVWSRPECDITEDVINLLAQRVGTPKTTSGGPLSNISGALTPSGPAPAAQSGALQPGATQPGATQGGFGLQPQR